MHVVIPKVVHEWLTCKLTEERNDFSKKSQGKQRENRKSKKCGKQIANLINSKYNL